MKLNDKIFRGEVYYADLSPIVGSEQGGKRPVVILQNNKGNKYATTTIVAPLTSRTTKAKLPTHIFIQEGIPNPSFILLEQIRVLDKMRLGVKVGEISATDMVKIDEAIKISLGV